MYPSLVFTLTGDPPAFAACIRSAATSGWRIRPTPFLIANEELIVVSASSPHYLFARQRSIFVTTMKNESNIIWDSFLLKKETIFSLTYKLAN